MYEAKEDFERNQRSLSHSYISVALNKTVRTKANQLSHETDES